jgi:hypothetical protein
MITKQSCRFLLLVTIGLLISYAVHDYYPENHIFLSEDMLSGVKVLSAPDLVIQGQDDQNNIWATRGFWAYKKSPGANIFSRQYHIPCGFNICWIGNFSVVRWVISRDVWVELLPFNDGSAIAVSANKIWFRSIDGQFTKTFQLKYPLAGVGGVGVGTGFLPSDFLLTRDGHVLFGEYWSNLNHDEIDIYASNDRGFSWENVYRFRKDYIRHVHGLQQDSLNDSIWISTGDVASQAKILNTTDFFKTVNVVEENSQQFRTIGLVFDSDYVYWGTDTEILKESGIYRLDRKSRSIEKLSDITGCIYMSINLENNLIVMSEAREGGKIEKDEALSLYVIKNGVKVRRLELDRQKKNIFFKNYSWIRLARGSYLPSLYLTFLNSRQHNGTLFVIPQASLMEKTEGESSIVRSTYN